jgi:flavorubredoxin
MFITDDIRYIGVNDHKKDLFEGQYIIPNGMAYNSYVILDEKIAVMDSVDADFGEEWLNNLEQELSGRNPDYLVVQHMEPDHSANIAAFMEKYPEAVVAASARAFTMMNQFFGTDFADRKMVVKEGNELALGAHTLKFIEAPLVHWPEVIMTYDSKDKVLFSADGFGKFGALDVEEDWACEARRYYMGIVGKYGIQVQKVLKKVADLDVAIICPLHGPVLKDNLSYYIGLYDTWSSYRPEDKGVVICVSSIYGHTMDAARLLELKLTEFGCPKVSVFDLARDDMAEAVEDAFRYDRLVLASVTYNGTIFPDMNTFISHLTERNYQNRTIAFMENGSWAPAAARIMGKLFEKSKNIKIAENKVTIKSALNEDSMAQIEALARELL